jgi:peptidoglycan hydrolase-like protein with peptidoglycan-binding domain
MKTPILFAVATLAMVLTAAADDQLRNVQTALKNQGFYYGDVDGASSPETTSAIRRYQIRNGLEVTGTLNPETLTALGLVAAHKKQPASAPAATAQNPPSVTNKGPVNIRRDSTVEDSDRDFLRKEEFKAATNNPPPPQQYYNNVPAPAAPSYPQNPRYSNVLPPNAPPPIPRNNAVLPPPEPLETPSADFPVLFAGTPFANAPADVQRDTLRRAQSLLSVQGFYRDIVDGLPGPATEEAVLTFQRAARLTLTGRLDLDTLGKLRLLPGNPGTQFGIEFRSPRHVFRGIWVERD